MSVWIKQIYKNVSDLLYKIFSWISNPPESLTRKIQSLQTPFILILTLIPILNIGYILATSGENNHSNDVVFWVDLVEKSLRGEATFSLFLTRSWIYPHFFALHTALELLNAHLLGWNVYATLFFGFFLNLIKLGLLFDLFTFQHPKNPLKWWLLPLLSAVVFSNMEVTTFTGQNTATLIGMSLFGAVLSLWAVVRFPGQWKGVGFSLLGGLISTWTFALGLLTWPVVLVSMVLAGYRRVKHYLIFLAGAAVSLFPYAYFIVLNPVENETTVKTTSQTLLNINFILNLLGRPLVDLWDTSFRFQYKLVGAVGVVLAIACAIVFLVHFFRKDHSVVLPPLLIILLGFGATWMISMGRASMDAWYITLAWPFWQGILGFAFILLLQPAAAGSLIESLFEHAKKLGAVAALIIMVILYARSNINNEIYATLIYSRTPVSAACLRGYENAPTYCEASLFQWPIQRPEYIFELGRPIAQNQLSASSRLQYWSLQGDYLFERVKENRYAETAPLGWYDGLNGDRIDRYSTRRWERLDLLLYSPNSIQWSVDFPDYMSSAMLKSAVGIRNDDSGELEADGATFQVSIEGDGIEKEIVFEKHVSPGEHQWVPFEVDLSSYRGKEITLLFTSQPGKNNISDWAMYQYPVIEVKMEKHIEPGGNKHYTPENTDLFPGFRKPGAGDILWDGKNPEIWNLHNLTAVKDQPGVYTGGEDPMFQLNNPVDLCLADYTDIYIQYGIPPGVRRVAQVYVQLGDEPTMREERSAVFTILGDGKVHEYSFPIRLLELETGYNERLVNIRFDPVIQMDNSKGPIQFEALGLLRGDGPSICH